MDFVADQLIGLFAGRFYSMLLRRRPVDQTVRRSCFIASYVGYSSALGSLVLED